MQGDNLSPFVKALNTSGLDNKDARMPGAGKMPPQANKSSNLIA